MFQNRQVSILEWFILHILIAIPGVNIVVILVLLLSSKTNPSLKNLILFYFIVIIIGFFLWGVTLLSFLGNL